MWAVTRLNLGLLLLRGPGVRPIFLGVAVPAAADTSGNAGGEAARPLVRGRFPGPIGAAGRCATGTNERGEVDGGARLGLSVAAAFWTKRLIAVPPFMANRGVSKMTSRLSSKTLTVSI